MTGSDRAAVLLAEKAQTNRSVYADLSPPRLSRQVQRRFVRQTMKRAVRAAKVEITAKRRG